MTERPKKEIITVQERRVKTPAHYKDVETGSFQEVTIIDESGKRRVEQKPIKNRIFVEAVIEDVFAKKEVWPVTHKGERHEFSSQADADRFYKTVT